MIIPACTLRASSSTPEGCWPPAFFLFGFVSKVIVRHDPPHPKKTKHNWHDLRQRLFPRPACAVFHAPSSLLPPSPSMRLSPCRSCLLIFFPPLLRPGKQIAPLRTLNEPELPRTHAQASQKERGNKSLRQLNSLTATKTAEVAAHRLRV